MNSMLGAFSFKKQASTVEWKLLAFLILFMDVKLVIKLAAIVMIYLLQPNFRFGFKFRNSRLPLFYLLVIGIALFNWILYRNFSVNYSVMLATGILFWLACILVIHQVKLFVERTDTAILHNTLTLFFIINIAASAFNLGIILMEIGLRNPFLYQGDYQKYFIRTGDYIKGITLDSSTTNAMISAFGVVYFLYRQKFFLSIACMAVLILAVSNVTSMILLTVFAGLFIFKSSRDQKSIMTVCILLLLIFFTKFSPQNDNYISEIYDKYISRSESRHTAPKMITPLRERPDSQLNAEEKKEKIATLFIDSLERERLKATEIIQPGIAGIKERPEIPGDSIHTAKFQWKRDTTTIQRQILSYVEAKEIAPEEINHKYTSGSPGKLLAFKESVDFLKEHPTRMITGNGIGNFSSKLAFRATGLKFAGGYPQKLIYSHPDFLENHMALYTFFFTKNAESHSMLNTPFSVYDQLLMEYGVLGLVAFFICYAGFFLKRFRYLSYGIPLLAMMLAAFVVDYWYEQLSIVVLFELMMFINIKENKKEVAHG